MSALVISEVAQLEASFEWAERLREEAAEAEQAAYLDWQAAYSAYEIARDEASAAWAAWSVAVVP